jgi:alcohol dehydrogenase (NADP+)
LIVSTGINITGSIIGGIPQTEELLAFSAEHSIEANVKIIGVDDVDDALVVLGAGDAGFRYVIDMGTLAAHAPQ